MNSRADNATNPATHFARASIVNSLLLLPAAAIQFDVLFWVLVATNFALMHAVWVVPLVRRRGMAGFRLFTWPLIAFAVMGNGALFLWGDRLLAVFPA
jgi:hypothetical protein